jgi:hypothetical protein
MTRFVLRHAERDDSTLNPVAGPILRSGIGISSSGCNAATISIRDSTKTRVGVGVWVHIHIPDVQKLYLNYRFTHPNLLVQHLDDACKYNFASLPDRRVRRGHDSDLAARHGDWDGV